MGKHLLRAYSALALLLALAGSLAHADDLADGPQQRETAATRLFEIPLYRELTTRQVYEALDSLPAEQRRQAVAALREPKIVQALKQAIIRSTATTFNVREIEVVRRFLSADEARSILDKVDLFRLALLKEAVAAAIINPELAPLITPSR